MTTVQNVQIVKVVTIVAHYIDSPVRFNVFKFLLTAIYAIHV